MFELRPYWHKLFTRPELSELGWMLAGREDSCHVLGTTWRNAANTNR